MIPREEFDHVLIPFGQYGTTLARIEARDDTGDGVLIMIRRVRNDGTPRDKHSRPIWEAGALAKFNGWPSAKQVKQAKQAYHESR